MTETSTQLGTQTVISALGINGAAGMVVFGFQKFLFTLPENLKFWLFWAGIITAALVVSWGVFRFMYDKKVDWLVVGSVAALGIMVMVIASPFAPLVFPFNPVALSMGDASSLQTCGVCGGTDNGVNAIPDYIYLPPVLLGLCALIIGYSITKDGNLKLK